MKKIFFYCIVIQVIVLFHNSIFAQNSNNTLFPTVSTENINSVQLDRFSVQISVLGNMAITTYDMTFKNKENRVLEGQMEFPLQENEQVIGVS